MVLVDIIETLNRLLLLYILILQLYTVVCRGTLLRFVLNIVAARLRAVLRITGPEDCTYP